MAGSTSGNFISIDDPANVGAFLARMHRNVKPSATPLRRPITPPQSQIAAVDTNGHIPAGSSDDLDDSTSQHVSDSGHKTPDEGLTSNVTSMAASPDPGKRAPPPTPAAQTATAAATSQGTIHFEPVPEDETDVLVTLAENSSQNLLDSKHAFPRPAGHLLHKTRAALSTKNANTTAIKRTPVPDSQRELAEQMKDVNYQESVLSDFRRKTEGLVKVTQCNLNQHSAVETLPKVAGSAGKLVPPITAIHSSVSGSEAEDETSDRAAAASVHCQDHNLHVRKPASLPITEPSCPSNNVFGTDGQVPATPSNPTRSSQKLKDLLAEEVVKNDVVEKSKDDLTQAMMTNIDKVKTPIVVATPPKSHTEEEEPEDREHLTHFKSWGSAIARSSPKARPRMVMLSGIPMNADNTLVASLLHGGAIEAYKLITGSEIDTNKRATALFTEADAAQKYYDKYPNGVEFKYNGRKSVAFVTMGKEADILSSVLRGQLEAGASRIVRATGADEDWGMRALHKLAEGKSRKIEGIADYWRDEIRTIVFRFTNIPDAVQFRGQLMRNDEWEMCNIQFMDDPCAKATGVHVDSKNAASLFK